MTRSIDSLITDLSAGGRKPYAAMQELEELGEAAVMPLVHALRITKNDVVCDRAATTLTRIGKAAVPALIKVYGDEFDPKIKIAVVDALGEIADPASLPVLASALQDPDPNVRRLADYGIKQIQRANPLTDIKPHLARAIEPAKAIAPPLTDSYQGALLAPERRQQRGAFARFFQRWVLGLDTAEEIEQQVGNPFARWIIRPLRKGFSCFLVITLLVYAVLCVWEGFAWTAELSPTYGLRIIRFLVIALLSVVSAFTLPFRIGEFLLFAVLNMALLFFPIGIVHGFTLSPEGESHARNSQRHEVLLLSFIAIGFVLVSYGYDILSDNYFGLIISYLLVSPLRILILGAGVMLLVARNLFHSVKGQQPVQQPLI